MSDRRDDEPLTSDDAFRVIDAPLPTADELRSSVPEGLEPVSKLVRALEAAERDGRRPVIGSAVPSADLTEDFTALMDDIVARLGPERVRVCAVDALQSRAASGLANAPAPATEPQAGVEMETLISSMLPEDPPPVPSQGKVLQAQRNATARWELLQEFGYRTAEQVSEGRSRAANRHALASRWRKEKKVFAVDWNRRGLFPDFQFADDGTPLPIVHEVLEALPTEHMSEWEVALWWTSANGWLESRRPVDLIRPTATELSIIGGQVAHTAVVEAARHLAEPLPL